MLECAWSYGDSKLGLGCQQHSNDLSSKMYGSDLGFICYIHELRKKYGRECQEYTSLIVWSVQIYSSIAFFLLDKSNKNDGLYAWIQCLAGVVDCEST
jgi:hypothetical protein